MVIEREERLARQQDLEKARKVGIKEVVDYIEKNYPIGTLKWKAKLKEWEMTEQNKDGWIDPSQDAFLKNFNTPKAADEFLARWAKANGYVRLAEDQSFPDTYTIQRAFTGLSWSTCENLQLWLSEILINWRKVILE